MEFHCYRCGQPGHVKSECPSERAVPAAPPAESGAPEHPSSKPVPAPRPAWHVTPPTGAYLEAKAELGMPVQGNLGRLLSVPCPWCGAGKRSFCVNGATGRRKLRSHEARYAAALAPLESTGLTC